MESHIPIVDLTSPQHPLTLSQRPVGSQHSPAPLQDRADLVFTTFSRTGVVVRSSSAQALKTTISAVRTAEEPDVVVLQLWAVDKALAQDVAVSNPSETRRPKKQKSSPSAVSPPSPQTPSSRPQRRRNLPAMFPDYTGTLLQPRTKRTKR